MENATSDSGCQSWHRKGTVDTRSVTKFPCCCRRNCRKHPVAATGSRRSRFRCAKNCGLEPCTSKLAIFQRQRQSLNASKHHKTVAAITKHHETSRGLRAEAPLSWMEFHRRPWNANELNLDQLCSILKERPVFSNLCQVFLLSPWQRLRSDELP